MFLYYVSRVAQETGILLGTEETVNPLDSLSNLSNWKLEMSSFLKELQCPLNFLFEGDLDTRLTNTKHRLLLLDFLLSENLTARILKFGVNQGSGEVQSSTASQLSATLNALELQPPPVEVTPDKFFKKLQERIAGIEPAKRDKLIGKPLFCGGKLNESQWDALSKVKSQKIINPAFEELNLKPKIAVNII
jgi:hypothetical protein